MISLGTNKDSQQAAVENFRPRKIKPNDKSAREEEGYKWELVPSNTSADKFDLKIWRNSHA